MKSECTDAFPARERYFGGRATVLALPAHTDARGLLCPIDFDRLPFQPRRIFTVSLVGHECLRGGHSHRSGQQLLVCVQGGIRATMRCDGSEESVLLEPGGIGLVCGPGIWCEQRYEIADSVLMVLASEPYDPTSYVYDWT